MKVLALLIMLLATPALAGTLDCKAREQKCICACDKATKKCQANCATKTEFPFEKEDCLNACPTEEDCKMNCKIKRQECDEIKKEMDNRGLASQ